MGDRVHLAAVDGFLPVHQAAQPQEVLFVDDLAVGGIGEGRFAVLTADLLLQRRHQLVLHARLAEDIVGGYAGLAAVDELAKDDAAGCKGELCRLVHDAGALASKLQNGGGQVLCRPAQDLPADGLAAGKEDEVKVLVQQGGVLRPAAGDHGDILRGETLSNNLLRDAAHRRGVGAGLDDGGVACGDGVHQRVHGEEEGIVPGAHDEDVPVGGGLFIAFGGELGQGRMDGAAGRKAPGVGDHIGELAQDQARLAHIAFKSGLPQVCLQGAGNVRLVGGDGGF